MPNPQSAICNPPSEIALWPGEVPGDCGAVGPEGFRPTPPGAAPDTKWLTNVAKPTITVYRPLANNAGAAMLVCPGGGYWNLGWDIEGEEVAAWLSTIGITGIVLKYRVPRPPERPKGLPAPGPLLDAQRALSLVRSRAGEWGVDPHKIGMVGFSAGGHLVLAAATNFEQRAYAPVDDFDSASCRPDFAIALYSGYLVTNGTTELAPYMKIPPGTPPVFLVHATDDSISDADNSVVMYLALKHAGVPAELHVYATGGHGFGVRPSQHPVAGWTALCVNWLREIQVLNAE